LNSAFELVDAGIALLSKNRASLSYYEKKLLEHLFARYGQTLPDVSITNIVLSKFNHIAIASRDGDLTVVIDNLTSLRNNAGQQTDQPGPNDFVSQQALIT
jgi:hypothetical protein